MGTRLEQRRSVTHRAIPVRAHHRSMPCAPHAYAYLRLATTLARLALASQILGMPTAHLSARHPLMALAATLQRLLRAQLAPLFSQRADDLPSTRLELVALHCKSPSGC